MTWPGTCCRNRKSEVSEERTGVLQGGHRRLTGEEFTPPARDLLVIRELSSRGCLLVCRAGRAQQPIPARSAWPLQPAFPEDQTPRGLQKFASLRTVLAEGGDSPLPAVIHGTV